jgi:LPXTG-motif cell wall-anchored protein
MSLALVLVLMAGLLVAFASAAQAQVEEDTGASATKVCAPAPPGDPYTIGDSVPCVALFANTGVQDATVTEMTDIAPFIEIEDPGNAAGIDIECTLIVGGTVIGEGDTLGPGQICRADFLVQIPNDVAFCNTTFRDLASIDLSYPFFDPPLTAFAGASATTQVFCPPPPTTTTTTTTPPTFSFAGATTVCIVEVPTIVINFANTFPELAGATGTLTMTALNGTVVSTQPLVYQPNTTVNLLYPGTQVNADGSIADVPGWNLNAAGFWVRDPSDEFLREGIVLTYTVNPTATATITYPPESSACANPKGPFPPGVTPPTLPATGGEETNLALLASAALAIGAALMVATRRRARIVTRDRTLG